MRMCDVCVCLCHGMQACIAVGEVLGNPNVFQFDDYVELDAIKALKNDSANANVYALLELFSCSDLKVRVCVRVFQGAGSFVYVFVCVCACGCIVRIDVFMPVYLDHWTGHNMHFFCL